MTQRRRIRQRTDRPGRRPRAGRLPASGAGFTPLTDFTGDALPYGGGNPFADYRRGELPFAGLADLTDRRLGAGVIAANDEFFAERENLLVPGPAVFDPERFGHKGKVMDGWETRRRRGRSAQEPHPDPEDHDWALVRLGAPGVIRGIVVDTAHFRGNYPQAVSVEAATALPARRRPRTSSTRRWSGPPSYRAPPIGGHAENAFAVHVERRFTHLRLRQHPDGGVARLRVLRRGGARPGLAGRARHLRPGRAGERRHGRGRLRPLLLTARAHHPARPLPQDGRRLGDPPAPRHRARLDPVPAGGTGRDPGVEIDTAYLKGNAAGWAALSIRDGADGEWVTLMPRVRLQPDTNHRFLVDRTPATHVRIDIFPDGGISRLRLYGSLTEQGAARLAERAERTA